VGFEVEHFSMPKVYQDMANLFPEGTDWVDLDDGM
jgi:hypothetical protein